MKFTVDTEKKILTLLEPTTFRELNSIKKFIGEDAQHWSIEAKEVIKDIHHYNDWWYRPLFGTFTQTSATQCDFVDVTQNTANSYQFCINSNGEELSSYTISDVLERIK